MNHKWIQKYVCRLYSERIKFPRRNVRVDGNKTKNVYKVSFQELAKSTNPNEEIQILTDKMMNAWQHDQSSPESAVAATVDNSATVDWETPATMKQKKNVLDFELQKDKEDKSRQLHDNEQVNEETINEEEVNDYLMNEEIVEEENVVELKNERGRPKLTTNVDELQSLYRRNMRTIRKLKLKIKEMKEIEVEDNKIKTSDDISKALIKIAGTYVFLFA